MNKHVSYELTFAVYLIYADTVFISTCGTDHFN